jgi:hypothetical protein
VLTDRHAGVPKAFGPAGLTTSDTRARSYVRKVVCPTGGSRFFVDRPARSFPGPVVAIVLLLFGAAAIEPEHEPRKFDWAQRLTDAARAAGLAYTPSLGNAEIAECAMIRPPIQSVNSSLQ